MIKQNKKNLSIKEICLFAILGALMFISKIVMEALPNIHLLGMLTITYTIVFRKKALIPIYVYVLLNGLFAGFNAWWIPYLYIWTILWGVTMLLPKKMNKAVATVVYTVVCALHGLFYGAIYAPAQAILFGLDFKGMIAWIIAGLPFDLVHAAHNFILGMVLIMPIIMVLSKTEKYLKS